jgi:hypothetical protein
MVQDDQVPLALKTKHETVYTNTKRHAHLRRLESENERRNTGLRNIKKAPRAIGAAAIEPNKELPAVTCATLVHY